MIHRAVSMITIWYQALRITSCNLLPIWPATWLEAAELQPLFFTSMYCKIHFDTTFYSPGYISLMKVQYKI